MQEQIKLVTVKDILRHDLHKDIDHYHTLIEDNLKIFLKNKNTKPLSIEHDSDKMAWVTNFSDDDKIGTEIFNFAKLHWLIHDIKRHGVSFVPQAFTIWEDASKTFHLNAHPGTYRFYAIMYNKMLTQEILLLDTKNFFHNIQTLNKDQIQQIVNNGFIRNRNTYTENSSIERESNLSYTEYHENLNNHDVNIKINYEELMKIYKDEVTLFLPYGVTENVCDNIKEFNFKIKNLQKRNHAEFLIPHECDFKGIGIFVDVKTNIEFNNNFRPSMLFSLDIIDDIAYSENKKVMIFNNSSMGCRRLIPGILSESKPEYLNKFLWTKKTNRISQNDL